MDNLDDSENNAKVSDSAYSNSCSNSQSRRSRSSKSTHSGSNSSGSSGYGGKQSTSGSSNDVGQPPETRNKDKEQKKKKSSESVVVEEQVQPEPAPEPAAPVTVTPKVEEKHDIVQIQAPTFVQPDTAADNLDLVANEGNITNHDANIPTLLNLVTSRASPALQDGFSSVISMHDGIIMYTTPSLTTALGFPKDMWLGRSFIDFIHPKDRSTFATQITSGVAAPKNVIGLPEKEIIPETSSVSTMFCRIRRYRGLSSGFGVKEQVVTYVPFHLRLSFKKINDEEGKAIYLVVQATPFFSAFSTPNETVTKPVPFVIRHVANGSLEYIDNESVPYLGYLPQDIIHKDALQLYHPDDLTYLEEVYENIVRDGGMSRSKPYRILTQNGHYLKLETEWSSFINPWSRKLEFVIGKHHVIEGPRNPDVFQSPEITSPETYTPDEEVQKAQMLRNNIFRIMNQSLTKPTEVAKLQMSKRCQDLASFMESLMEEPPRAEDELRVEILDQDNSYYERDSVMLGGISPHHEYNDSNSSTETPLSYNQLNYNETLQRYFDSHQPYNYYEDYNTTSGENILDLKMPKDPSKCLSPVAHHSKDSVDMTCSSESGGLASFANSPPLTLRDYQPMRLTESLIIKHNTEMEKVLVKKHREFRFTKCDREKVSNENRIKKIEHLARCNAAFQPTSVVITTATEQPLFHSRTVTSSRPPVVSKCRTHRFMTRNVQGVKRPCQQTEGEGSAHKYCRQTPSRLHRNQSSMAPAQVTPTYTTTVAASHHWPQSPSTNVSSFIPSIGIPHQMPLLGPLTGVTDVIPMYYVPATGLHVPATSLDNQDPSRTTASYMSPPMPYMMYGQALIGAPFVYSPMAHPLPYAMQQSLISQGVYATPRPLGLTARNYEEACRASLPTRETLITNYQPQPSTSGGKQGERPHCTATKKFCRGSGRSSDSQSLNKSSAMDLSDNISSSNSPKQSVKESLMNQLRRTKNSETISDEVKTDGESSYSSFYSSFFKTDSGSADDSGDAKKTDSQYKAQSNYRKRFHDHETRDWPRRKREPPWMEQVCVTSELVYQYKVLTKNVEEVLSEDKRKIALLEQPQLVNEQLGQLYLDLQLEGVAARLTLEEGITSSGSSGEETSTNANDTPLRKKKEYSKLVMIYEEDAPLPPPPCLEKMDTELHAPI